MIHYLTPYRSDKDLGRAYNDAISHLRAEESDWICLMDIDVMFLTPDAPAIIEEYVKQANSVDDKIGIMTCYTNRVGSKEQLLKGTIDSNPIITQHIRIAERHKMNRTASVIQGDLSGMLMLIKYSTWLEHKFTEGIGCLGVDTEYCRRLRDNGYSILRMNAIYVWHTYRLLNGTGNKKHLL